MKKPKKPDEELWAQTVMIDPAHCGSFISARIIREDRSIDAHLTLGDCSRTISWDFSTYAPPTNEQMAKSVADAEKKLQEAMKILTLFQLHLYGMGQRAAALPTPKLKKGAKVKRVYLTGE